MTFRGLLDRTVTVMPRIVAGTDARGNDLVVDGTPIPNVRAGRDQTDASEETDRRDQQRATHVYFLPPTSEDGVELAPALDGYARILDGDEIHEAEGEPEAIIRRRGGRLHHFEVATYRWNG